MIDPRDMPILQIGCPFCGWLLMERAKSPILIHNAGVMARLQAARDEHLMVHVEEMISP